MKRKKVFKCEHKGFGDYCHTCSPNIPRDSQKALKGEYGPKVQKKEERK